MTERFTIINSPSGDETTQKTTTAKNAPSPTDGYPARASTPETHSYDTRESAMNLPQDMTRSYPGFVRSLDGSRWLPCPLSTSYISSHRRVDTTSRSTQAVLPTDEKCSAAHTSNNNNDSRAAREVLDTGELLEMILLHLPTDDILALRRVSRKWASTVRLPRLRVRYFSKPQRNRPSDATEVLNVTHIPGVRVWSNQDAQNTRWVYVAVTPLGCSTILSDTNDAPSSWGLDDVHITHPPTTHLIGNMIKGLPSLIPSVVENACRDIGLSRWDYEMTMSQPHGIKLGDIARCAERLFQSRRKSDLVHRVGHKNGTAVLFRTLLQHNKPR